MSLDLDAVRQRVDQIDRIATEQIAHSVAQLTAGQEQMTREITKLQAVEQYVLARPRAGGGLSTDRIRGCGARCAS